MAVPTCIQNNILVELPKAFQDEIISESGIKFFKDTTFRPEWNATISGMVVSVPQSITIGDGQIQSFYPDRVRIPQIINPGDEIVFNYLVVMNRMQTDNVGEIYERDKPIDPYITTWTNPNKLRIFRVYLNNGRYECGLFNLKTKQWIDRVKCGEKGVDAFLSKYMPTENVSFNYQNLLSYDNKEYWKVDYINAIAIKRKDGNFDMVGEYVLVEPIREPRKPFEQGLIEVHQIEQDKDRRAVGRVVSIGEPLRGSEKLSVKPNDTIVTDIRYVERYEIDGHDYWVVRQKYIYGKQSVTNDNIRNS